VCLYNNIMYCFYLCTPSHSPLLLLLYFQDSYDHVSKYHNPKGHYGVFDAVADSLDDSDSLDYDYGSYDSLDDEEDEFIAVGKSRKRSRRHHRSR